MISIDIRPGAVWSAGQPDLLYLWAKRLADLEYVPAGELAYRLKTGEPITATAIVVSNVPLTSRAGTTGITTTRAGSVCGGNVPCGSR